MHCKPDLLKEAGDAGKNEDFIMMGDHQPEMRLKN